MKKNIVLLLLLLVTLMLIVLFQDTKFWKQSQKTSDKAQFSLSTDNEQHSTSTEGCSGVPIPSLTEGPYYITGSPQRENLYENGVPGEKIIISGYVYDTQCKPIADAWLDFWQADGKGEYDNQGHTLRGYQYTNTEGKYQITTVIPGEYPGRTPHIHVKIRATEGNPIITTQLFLPDQKSNESDDIFDKTLMIAVEEKNGKKIGSFNFIVNK